MADAHVVINGETYIVAKLKAMAGAHDETVDKNLLVQHENPIQHPHIVARKYDGKYQVILGIIPERNRNTLELVKIKVVSSVALKKARYHEPVIEDPVQHASHVTPSDFRNTPRVQDTRNKTRGYQGSKPYENKIRLA